ncbi:MAG: hypothetical protein GX383_07620 [Clostridium sp.]|jgi:uncharacterized membrane protein (DUF106 family)|nr:hypothetical protein [Clostridium sp.]
MQSNNFKKIEKITEKFNKMNRLSRLIIKYGTQAFMLMFFLGILTILLYKTIPGFNDYTFYLGTQIIKISFSVFAQAVIGGLLIDFFAGNG